MNIHQLIQAAGSVTILADRLKIKRARVAKWRDRGKVPILALYSFEFRMRKIIKDYESKNAKTKQAQCHGTKAQESADDGLLRGIGKQADNSTSGRSTKARKNSGTARATD
jgi:hypothetical protein